jgi:hypothetical protein
MPPSLVTRTTLIDDDGSDTTGTIIDNNEIQKLYDAIDQLASGAGAYTTFEYGGNLKVDGILTANGIAPTSGNANITGNLLVTGRLQVGGTAFGQATAPALRAGTVTPQSKQAMEVTSGDNAAWAAVRASAFISTEPGTNLADLVVTGGCKLQDVVPSMRGYQEKWQIVPAAATTNIDLSAGNHIILTLGTNISAFNISSSQLPIASGYVTPIVFHIQHDGVLRAITWTINGSGTRFSGGAQPQLASANGYITRVVIYYMAGYAVFGEQIGFTA